VSLVVFREPLTLFNFWLVSNGTTEEPRTAVSHPPDSDIVDELSSNYGVRTSLYKSSVWYDVAYSFGVFVDGRVYRRDLVEFQHGLSAYWNDTHGGHFVQFLFPEMHFTADLYVSFHVGFSKVPVF